VHSDWLVVHEVVVGVGKILKLSFFSRRLSSFVVSSLNAGQRLMNKRLLSALDLVTISAILVPPYKIIQYVLYFVW